MDAKYNYIIDSMRWRIILNLVGFGLWLAASTALLRRSELAPKICDTVRVVGREESFAAPG